jgi:hypothetical protein
MSEQEPSAEALKIANGIAQMRHPPLSDESREVIARDIDAYTATRVAEAVAAERARWRDTVFTEIQRLKAQRNRQKSNDGIREYQAKIETLTGLLHITQGDAP